MFKLIGIVIVVSVFVIGFESIRKWYTGDASPEETVTEIRDRVGKTISGNTEDRQTDNVGNSSAGKEQDSESLQSKLDKL
jgi:hypothetical protein